MSILRILDELELTSSRLEKEAILKREVDNDLLKKVFFLAYDPFTQFYIRKIPEYTPNQGEGIALNFALDSIGDLSKRLVTGNAGIAHLKSNLEALHYNDAIVLERVIGKDLKVGCSGSTANKVWPNLIHEYPCMLASGYDEKLVAKIKWPAMAQLKMDGMRFNAIVKDGKCEFRSRNGKEIQLLGNLEQEFIAMSRGSNLVYDGELVVYEDDKILDRQTGNGILNKAVKGTIGHEDARSVHATLWDVIPYDHFTKGKGTVQYGVRFAMLQSVSMPPKIHLVESQSVSNIEEARVIFEKYLAEGQEGIILKDSSAVWEDKRAKHLIKFKGELECDLKIVGIQEGTGKYVGKVGALICESADGVIKVDVGSGFNDAMRYNMWVDRNIIIGKVIAVKYNARIKNKQGVESLFLPIFLEIREDKTEADFAKDVK
jgi:hypothetical protein